MRTLDFPYCCTAKIVADLGESDIAAGGNQEVTKKEVNDYLRKTEVSYRAYGFAVLVVTTNNEQAVANKILKERGYFHSKWMSKSNHPETKVRLWHKPLLN